jgi:hypothetical protein
MKLDKRSAAVGSLVTLVIVLAGCASFPWRYYATQMPGECYDKGTLLGKSGSDGWPDRKLSECKPDPDLAPGQPAGKKLKCITLFDEDFYSLKADNEKCHKDLAICQAGPKPQ